MAIMNFLSKMPMNHSNIMHTLFVSRLAPFFKSSKANA